MISLLRRIKTLLRVLEYVFNHKGLHSDGRILFSWIQILPLKVATCGMRGKGCQSHYMCCMADGSYGWGAKLLIPDNLFLAK